MKPLLLFAVMMLSMTKAEVLYSLTPQNCYELQQSGENVSGEYTIFPYQGSPLWKVSVYCDMDTDGGGWTVIQRRADFTPRENFYRSWKEYKLGFGKLSGEFWLGLEHIHALTQQTTNVIRFDLEDFDNDQRYAHYLFFYIGGRKSNFKLTVDNYTGNAGDSFSYHNDMSFTTKDKDTDKWDTGNCAEE